MDLGFLTGVLLLRVFLLCRRRGRTVTAVQGLCMKKYPARGKRWVRREVEHKKTVRGVNWVQGRHSTPAAWLLLHYFSNKGEILEGI